MEILSDDLRVVRAQDRDVVYVYRVRYGRYGDNPIVGEFRDASGRWWPFEPYAQLPLDSLTHFTGYEMHELRRRIDEIDKDNEQAIRRLRDELNEVLGE